MPQVDTKRLQTKLHVNSQLSCSWTAPTLFCKIKTNTYTYSHSPDMQRQETKQVRNKCSCPFSTSPFSKHVGNGYRAWLDRREMLLHESINETGKHVNVHNSNGCGVNKGLTKDGCCLLFKCTTFICWCYLIHFAWRVRPRSSPWPGIQRTGIQQLHLTAEVVPKPADHVVLWSSQQGAPQVWKLLEGLRPHVEQTGSLCRTCWFLWAPCDGGDFRPATCHLGSDQLLLWLAADRWH